MGILHLVNRSPGESLALIQCLERAGSGDAVLLLESGVYATLKSALLAPRLAESLRTVTVYALAADLAARGIGSEEILAGVELVDYEGFVNLSILHTPILSWN
ncbi:MAG: sulfurtransferase complex subunit TusB [Candidatus Methylumidiphilus sp.]